MNLFDTSFSSHKFVSLEITVVELNLELLLFLTLFKNFIQSVLGLRDRAIGFLVQYFPLIYLIIC